MRSRTVTAMRRPLVDRHGPVHGKRAGLAFPLEMSFGGKIVGSDEAGRRLVGPRVGAGAGNAMLGALGYTVAGDHNGIRRIGDPGPVAGVVARRAHGAFVATTVAWLAATPQQPRADALGTGRRRAKQCRSGQ